MIHPLAHVDPDCEIGEGSRVWQFASVTRGTVLGEGCSIAPFAVLDGPILGARCVVSMHAAIGPGFVIGDEVFIGPSVTFCNDAWPSVSKDGWSADELRAGAVTIRVGDRTSIGANSVLLPGIVIGEGCMIAAGSVVSRDVPDGHIWRRDGKAEPLWSGKRRRMRLV
ncbi:MAG: DapH/DapD/GlmU-related protein [Caulobacter sp.]